MCETRLLSVRSPVSPSILYRGRRQSGRAQRKALAYRPLMVAAVGSGWALMVTPISVPDRSDTQPSVDESRDCEVPCLIVDDGAKVPAMPDRVAAEHPDLPLQGSQSAWSGSIWSSVLPRWSFSTSRSKRVWRLSQNLSVVPK